MTRRLSVSIRISGLAIENCWQQNHLRTKVKGTVDLSLSRVGNRDYAQPRPNPSGYPPSRV